jgi:fructokinase
VDLVKVSQADLGWLYPEQSVEQVAESWLERGPALVVVTFGPEGSAAFGRRGERRAAGLRVKVADTVGAGDAFMSGLLHRLQELRLLERERLETMPEELEEVLEHATRVSAFTCTRAGAEPPTRAELAAWSP